MSGIEPHHSPLTIAKESMAMGEKSGDKTFKILALVMMAATGVATLLHAAHVVWRDMRQERSPRRETGRSATGGHASEYEPGTETHPVHNGSDPECSWVSKARLTEREAPGETRYADRGGGRQARHH